MLSRLRSHHDQASGHFFSDALRFRCASEVGREASRSPWQVSAIRPRGHPARYLVPGDPFVRGTPADLDLDRRLPLAQGCYRLPHLKGVGLALTMRPSKQQRRHGVISVLWTDRCANAPDSIIELTTHPLDTK